MARTHDRYADQETVAHWQALARHSPLAIVCDLDGTLLPFSPSPTQSELSPRLISLLNAVAHEPGVQLVIVSGRLRAQIEHLMQPVPGAWLVAEHGAWRRRGGAWADAVNAFDADTDELAEMMEAIAGAASGALVERKTWSVAFHFRRVPQVVREAVQVEVDALINDWLRRHPGYERLGGNQVVEVRPSRMRKSLAISWLREHLGPELRLLAVGDDLTDEHMFGALGVNDDPVLVGPLRQSRARWQLKDTEATADLLEWILTVRSGAMGDPARLPEPLVARPTHFDEAVSHDLLVISNRLPTNVRNAPGQEERRHRNVGGLVSGLGPALEKRRGLWLGWSGRTIEDDQVRTIDLDETANPALAQIDFPETWYEGYYNGFSNRVLWPLFHTFPRYLSFVDQEWESYNQANRAFAEAATGLVTPDTPVWVHDYHLLLVGHELRRLGHRGPLGFFLHIPFPGPDLFGLLP